MKLNPELIRRNIMGEDVFIPTGDTALKNNGIFVMSPVGARVWELLEQGMDTEALIPTMLEEYEVDEKTLRTDVQEFLAQLTAMGLLIAE